MEKQMIVYVKKSTVLDQKVILNQENRIIQTYNCYDFKRRYVVKPGELEEKGFVLKLIVEQNGNK